jgi:integrase
VPLSSEAMVLVARQPRRGAFVFARPDGNAIRNARRTWLWALKRSGLVDVRIHDLRHSLASAMVNSGASLALVGAALGHATPATTQRYAHVANQALKEALDRATATNVIPLDSGRKSA